MNFSMHFEQDNTSHNKQKDMREHLGSNDEVINKTEWSPLLHHGGQSNKSHNLVKVNDERIAFKRSTSSLIIYIFLTVIGLLTLTVSMFGHLLGMSSTGNPLYGIGVGLIFTGAGVVLLLKGGAQINMDCRLNAMWKGKIDPDAVINKKSIDGYTSLKELHAVQVIQELFQDDVDDDGHRGQSFYSYEINLVMHDGKRVNVLDHGNKKAIDEQAKMIATLFDVPLWDGCRNFHEGGWEGRFSQLGNLFRWGKNLLFFLVVGFILFNFYTMYADSKAKKAKLASMTPQEKAELSSAATTELLAKVKTGNISLPMIDALLRKGAYLDEKDVFGRTPLFYAVMHKNFDQINIFIRKNADLSIIDNEGKGLKDLLDPINDSFLYYYIVDAELSKEARSRGKTIISIDRKFDTAGHLISQKVNEQ